MLQVSMVLSNVGGVSLREPAEDGVVCTEHAVFVAEKCTFRRVGIDSRAELWREILPERERDGDLRREEKIEMMDEESRAMQSGQDGESEETGEREIDDSDDEMWLERERGVEEGEGGGGVQDGRGNVLFGTAVGSGVVMIGNSSSRISFCTFQDVGIAVSIGDAAMVCDM